ncbi:MAG: Nif3-like dinuclear metal center hexameric protein [Bacteroidales bacterium]|nr:Nif3-like dinuclear metal center hexameric protein [Bacteroidales bacterium]
MQTTTIGDVVAWLDSRFCPELQEDYDNAGFLLGDCSLPYRGAMVALDVTPTVIDEAINNNVNLIVSHHPMIFRGLKRITFDDELGCMVFTLLRKGISVYAAHTNLDNLPWGVNGALAEKLQLCKCHILRPLSADPTVGAGMIGQLQAETPVETFFEKVKQTLHLPYLRTNWLGEKRTVKRVAICGGSGAFLIDDALQAKADVLLTADLKYHDFQVPNKKMLIADIGHYESEQFAKEIICDTISGKFSNFACLISQCQQSLVKYI